MSSATKDSSNRLEELALLFLRLGVTAFGGPAAHIAMMHDEVVKRRKWLDEQQFLDLMGATNLIPGPNSTQMAIHMGLERAGLRGMIVTGSCLIFPSAVLVTILTWLYVQYGTTSQAEWLFYGIKPVIIAFCPALGFTRLTAVLSTVRVTFSAELNWLATISSLFSDMLANLPVNLSFIQAWIGIIQSENLW